MATIMRVTFEELKEKDALDIKKRAEQVRRNYFKNRDKILAKSKQKTRENKKKDDEIRKR